MALEDDIHIRKVGHVGRITLTRPKALNALTYEMCLAIEETLDEWAEDDLSLVLIDAEGERAFCAGGDIAELYQTGKAGDYEYGRTFWADEYRLNAKIKQYSIPYIAIMDGITMGGGVGISAHGSDRVVTEGSMVAMPECGIGLVPDVGGSFILSRSPGHLGEYLAATGYRMGPGDAVLAGFADLQVQRDRLGELKQALEETGDLAVLGEFAGPADPPQTGPYLKAIDQHFSKPTAVECVLSLESEDSDWARETAKLMRRGCPLSVACAYEMIRRARSLDELEQALEAEYRFTFRSMSDGELIEGIRAQIIDKDRDPKWRLQRLEDLGETDIERMLAPLDNIDGENRELTLSGGQA